MAVTGQFWTAIAVLGAVSLLAGRHFVADCGPVAVMALPGGVTGLERSGEAVWIATGEGGLARFDTSSETVETVMTFPGQTVADVGARGDQICLTAFKPGESATRLHLIDLEFEELTRTVELGQGGLVVGGVLAGDRVAVVEPDRVRFIDASTGAFIGQVIVPGGSLGGAHLEGDRLYVARSYAGGLAVIDTSAMQLLKLIKTQDRLSSVLVVGKSAFVWGSLKALGLIDLESRAYRLLDVPPPQEGSQHAVVAEGSDVFVLGTEAIFRLSVGGTILGQTPLPQEVKDLTRPGVRRTLVHVRDGAAFVGIGDRIARVRLNPREK